MLQVLFSLLLSLSVHRAEATDKTAAAQCTAFDLRRDFNPPRNQGDSEYCFAFTAADLLGYKIGLKPPNEVSAYNLISHYISMTPSELNRARSEIIRGPRPKNSIFVFGDPYAIEYGQTHQPIYMRGKGYVDLILAQFNHAQKLCLEADSPSEIFGKDYKDNEQKDFLAFKISEAADRYYYDDLIIKEYNAAQANPNCRPAPGQSVSELKQTASVLNDFAAAAVRQKADEECKHPLAGINFSVHSQEMILPLNLNEKKFNAQKARDLLKLLNDKKPIAVAYDFSALSKRESGSHVSSIIGRRWVKNRCEIEIRNSYGKKCEGNRDGVSCEDGYWWVDVKDFAPYVRSATWID